MAIRLCWRIPFVSPDLGPGTETKTLYVCPQFRRPVWLHTSRDWGHDGGCQNGAVSFPTDLVDKYSRSPTCRG
jgi:hypothetical protein